MSNTKRIKNIDETPVKERAFTDRDDLRNAFWEKYNKAKADVPIGKDIHVISYYGIGGIGKSRLFEQLRAEIKLNKEIKTPYYAEVDLLNCTDSRDAVEKIANKLKKRYKFDFTLFDICNYEYSQKIGENPESPRTKGIIDNSPVLKFLLDLVSEIPMTSVGMGVHAITFADKLFAGAKDLLNSHKKEFYGINELTPDEHHKLLLKFFAKDIKRNMQKKKSIEPLVIFLDTYEKFVNELQQVGDPLQNDLWLRGDDGVVCMIPGVLWVIGGREKLKWEEIDDGWTGIVEQHNLSGLSMQDSIAFLKAEGIDDGELQTHIAKLTDGTPVYLNLCIDHYENLVKGNVAVTPDSFGKNTRDLVSLFIKYMDKSQQDMVYMFACMGKWTDETVSRNGSLLIPGFGIFGYETIRGLSFVKQLDSGEYMFHQVMGEVLLDNASETVRKSMGERLIETYKEALSSQNFFDINYADALYYTARGGVVLYPEREDFEKFYKEKLEENLQKFAEAGMAEKTCEIIDMLLSKFEKNTDDSLYLSLLHDRLYIYGLIGICEENINLSRELVEKRKSLLGEDHRDTLQSMNVLAVNLEAAGKMEEAYDLEKQVLEKLKTTLGEDHADTLAAMNNLSHTFIVLGRYEDAYELDKTVLEKRKNLFGEDCHDTLVSMGNLALILDKLKRHEEAYDLQIKALEKMKTVVGEDHPDTLRIMSNLGATLSSLKNYDEAYKLRQEALEKMTATLGENHHDTIVAMGNLATTLADLEKHDEAYELKKEVFEKLSGMLGSDHPDTLTAMNNLSITLSAMNEFEQVCEMQQKVFEKRVIILGENHPVTLNSMSNYASSLSDVKRYDEAIELQKDVIERSKVVLGENHVDTLFRERILAYIFSDAKQYIEELKILRALVVKQKAVLGETHEYTLESVKNIATIESMFKLRPVHHHSHTKKKKKRK